MRLVRLFLVLIVALFCHAFSFAQVADSSNTAFDSAKVDIVQDYKVKKLLAKHIEINAASKTRGYRIKIHFGADKSEAYEVKKLFLEKFPDVAAYSKYDQPNFNVRVGDFRTKLEAYNFLKIVQVEFPSAFIVKDAIEFPALDAKKQKAKK